MAAAKVKFWAVIPAAGSGVRMGANVPKQYLQIKGRYILEHTLERFCRHPEIAGIMLALAEGDPYWEKMELARHEKIMCTTGGAERCHSVLNGLRALAQFAEPHDWILVHDAARPCLRREDISLLMDTLKDHPVGGILALPVRDTMKRSGVDNEIDETVERKELWHALTPQMFRLSELITALEKAMASQILVTDEAQAMELDNRKPRLVQGHPDNIKITHRNDLPLAELFLSQQEHNI
jgi:2-C-methyl-D-erythritol 4-phosphate cytidylyltransferase